MDRISDLIGKTMVSVENIGDEELVFLIQIQDCA